MSSKPLTAADFLNSMLYLLSGERPPHRVELARRAMEIGLAAQSFSDVIRNNGALPSRKQVRESCEQAVNRISV